MNQNTEQLRRFLDSAHSVYHVIANLETMLKEAGYTRLLEQNHWDLTPGGKYYLIRGGSSLIAFRVPQGQPRGFLISASHSDRPGFQLKENFEVTGHYVRGAVECYGGMLMTTWLDRPLSVAGRVMVETEEGIRSQLIDFDRDLALIPNVAIHMNRQINEGYKWNPAVDMQPLMGTKATAGSWNKLLEEAAGGKVLGQDLYLYPRTESRVWGLENEFISAPGLDDLQCVWGCTQGFLQAGGSGSIPVLCAFDSEEIGSGSAQGAGSTLLLDVITRICAALDAEKEAMLAQSFLVSADNAHAIHPNHPELADPGNAPLLGGGVVIKHSASLSYCSDGLSAALFRKVCVDGDIPVQIFYNRADIRGGSTLGRISLAQVSIPTVDIGLPQLAMHSSYETAAVADTFALEKAMTAYFSSTLEATEDGYTLK